MAPNTTRFLVAKPPSGSRELGDSRNAVLNLIEDLNIEKAELAEAKAKDEAILASIGDGVIAINPDRIIIVMNKEADKMLGWRDGEAIGKLYEEIVSLEDEKGNIVPLEERPLAKAFTQTTTTTNLYLLSKNKIKFPVAITMSPIVLDNKIPERWRFFMPRLVQDKRKTYQLNQSAQQDGLDLRLKNYATPHPKKTRVQFQFS